MGCAVGLRRNGIVMYISSDVGSAFVISSIELMSGDAAEDGMTISSDVDSAFAIPSIELSPGDAAEDDMDISVSSDGVIDIEPESSGPKHRPGPQSRIL